MAHEQQPSSAFSDEALAIADELRHWVAGHKTLVIVGTTAIALGLCSLSALVVQTITTEYIPDIHGSYLPGSIFIGSHSLCRPDERFPGGPPMMQDHGGITVMVTSWGAQVYHHAPENRFCTLLNQ